VLEIEVLQRVGNERVALGQRDFRVIPQ
jgi:hypothetical protein